jgi:hypothetical protein
MQNGEWPTKSRVEDEEDEEEEEDDEDDEEEEEVYRSEVVQVNE